MERKDAAIKAGIVKTACTVDSVQSVYVGAATVDVETDQVQLGKIAQISPFHAKYLSCTENP